MVTTRGKKTPQYDNLNMKISVPSKNGLTIFLSSKEKDKYLTPYKSEEPDFKNQDTMYEFGFSIAPNNIKATSKRPSVDVKEKFGSRRIAYSTDSIKLSMEERMTNYNFPDVKFEENKKAAPRGPINMYTVPRDDAIEKVFKTW